MQGEPVGFGNPAPVRDPVCPVAGWCESIRPFSFAGVQRRFDTRRAKLMVVMTLAALFTLTARADWQWVEVGTVENDISQDEITTVWATEDCELISDASGAYLYHSGETVKKCERPRTRRKKRPSSRQALR